MGSSDNNQKNKKFFGMEVGDTVKYLLVAILVVIFIRQVAVLF